MRTQPTVIKATEKSLADSLPITRTDLVKVIEEMNNVLGTEIEAGEKDGVKELTAEVKKVKIEGFFPWSAKTWSILQKLGVQILITKEEKPASKKTGKKPTISKAKPTDKEKKITRPESLSHLIISMKKGESMTISTFLSKADQIYTTKTGGNSNIKETKWVWSYVKKILVPFNIIQIEGEKITKL